MDHSVKWGFCWSSCQGEQEDGYYRCLITHAIEGGFAVVVTELMGVVLLSGRSKSQLTSVSCLHHVGAILFQIQYQSQQEHMGKMHCYFTDASPCRTNRLKISYIWSCCALSCIGTSMSSRNCPSATSTYVLRYQKKLGVLSNDMGQCIIEGICDFMCLSIPLWSSTGVTSCDSMLVIATFT